MAVSTFVECSAVGVGANSCSRRRAAPFVDPFGALRLADPVQPGQGLHHRFPFVAEQFRGDLAAVGARVPAARVGEHGPGGPGWRRAPASTCRPGAGPTAPRSGTGTRRRRRSARRRRRRRPTATGTARRGAAGPGGRRWRHRSSGGRDRAASRSADLSCSSSTSNARSDALSRRSPRSSNRTGSMPPGDRRLRVPGPVGVADFGIPGVGQGARHRHQAVVDRFQLTHRLLRAQLHVDERGACGADGPAPLPPDTGKPALAATGHDQAPSGAGPITPSPSGRTRGERRGTAAGSNPDSRSKIPTRASALDQRDHRAVMRVRRAVTDRYRIPRVDDLERGAVHVEHPVDGPGHHRTQVGHRAHPDPGASRRTLRRRRRRFPVAAPRDRLHGPHAGTSEQHSPTRVCT